MPTPRGGYFTADGEKVPSVTTVLGRFKESGGLMHWAWTQGRNGLDYRDVRDQAAESGTLAHDMVEMWARGEEVVCPPSHIEDVRQRATKAYEAFAKWASQSKLQVTSTEVGMVSETYKFGGTLDAILVDGQRAIGDWKASNAIYPEYLLQLAAYGKLWEENYPDEPVTGGFHLVRFDKVYADFHHHHWSELDTAWRAFLLLRELYELDKELKARVK